ncbi:MAG: TPD domain-containing protein [Candidatus Poseidoniaceae archaeon]|nr:TPD domain-containing protein [Candidatus Poseidoniaceae archaeon]MDP7000852.1 TPD domain-containing protein [Candidatus Poseidoniaceae archaeon]
MSENKRGGNSSNRRKNKRKKKRYGGAPRSSLIERNAEFDVNARTMAIERFSRKPLPMAFPKDVEPKIHELIWENTPVPLAAEAEAAKLVVKRGEFGFLPDERVDNIANSLHGSDINIDQALSLRSALLQEKTVYGHHRLQRQAKDISRLYEEGVGILDLSQRFDAPPVNTFRAMLSARGWSKARIKDSLKSPEKRLSERDIEEFTKAEEADRVSNVDQSETHDRADLFEDILCDWFEANGVNFRRQSEMVKEQTSQHGRPLKTPDLLMLDDVRINGEPVAWIDAKHFYGADVSFQRKKTSKQTARYVEEWGQGAIVYRHGFCDNIHIAGTVLLDSSPLDLSRLFQSD